LQNNLILTLAVSATVFEIFTLKDKKNADFTHPPLIDATLEFLDETYLAKTRGMRLLYGENFVILTSTVFLSSTRVTDGRTGDSIYAL